MKKIVILLLFCCAQLHGQKDSLAPINLQEVELKLLRLNTSMLRFPAALVRKQLAIDYAGPQQSLQEYIEDLPGVVSFNRTNFTQDLRLSIRGFGARSAFGIRGIKLVVDGIPETTPDGQGQLDNLPLALLSSIELARGPNSLRFGNASGGVLYLNTLDNIEEKINSFSVQKGSFGQANFQWTGGLKGDNTQFIYHASHAKNGGYRDHSSFSSSVINLKLKQKLSPYTKVVAQFNFTNSPEALDSGGQTWEEFNTNPRNARDRNVQFNAGENIQHLKSGIHLDHQKGANAFEFYAFTSERDFEGRLPFNFGGWINLERSYSGHGGSYARNWKKGLLEGNNQVGYAYGRQQDVRSRFINNDGSQGALTLNQKEYFNSFGAYFIQHLNYLNWTLNAGIRWDNNQLGLNDYFIEDGVNSAEKSLKAFSPQLGISYAFSPKLALFYNRAKSYETPSLSELSADPNGGGGFNKSLGIQEAVNHELGLNFKSNHTRASLVYFKINTKNDLVPYRLSAFEGRTFYRNAGSTQRQGWEIFISHQLVTKLNLQLTWNSGKFTYTDYENNGTRLDGNRLPGLPNNFGQWSMNYTPKKGWQVRYARTYRGEIFADDSNTNSIAALWRDDLQIKLPLKQKLKLLLGVNNMFNVHYSDNIRINAFGGRFYEAAPGREVYARLYYRF